MSDVGSLKKRSASLSDLRTEVSLLERGRREPRPGTLVSLARGLGIPLGDLLEGVT